MSKKIYNKKEISELVDDKGAKLKGRKKINQVDNASSSKSTIQLYSTYYGESVEPKSIKETANDKMKGVLEDILSKKRFSKDVLDKLKYGQGIPEVDIIKDDQPVLVRKISHIKSLLDRDDISGEEKGILLNSLLSINLVDIPAQYKRELARKLGY
jgi:hypothetical protein